MDMGMNFCFSSKRDSYILDNFINRLSVLKPPSVSLERLIESPLRALSELTSTIPGQLLRHGISSTFSVKLHFSSLSCVCCR